MTQPAWSRLLTFNCTGCGNCCRDTVVCITGDDVRRICDATGRRPHSFVQFFREGEVQLAKQSPFWINFDDYKAVLGLRWKDDHCIFLQADNRCAMYEHRPVTCRQHPFDITLSDTGAVQQLSLSRIVDCPHSWDGQVTRRQLRALLQWNDQQTERYLAKVQQWNRSSASPRTPPMFVRSLGL